MVSHVGLTWRPQRVTLGLYTTRTKCPVASKSVSWPVRYPDLVPTVVSNCVSSPIHHPDRVPTVASNCVSWPVHQPDLVPQHGVTWPVHHPNQVPSNGVAWPVHPPDKCLQCPQTVSYTVASDGVAWPVHPLTSAHSGLKWCFLACIQP